MKSREMSSKENHHSVIEQVAQATVSNMIAREWKPLKHIPRRGRARAGFRSARRREGFPKKFL